MISELMSCNICSHYTASEIYTVVSDINKNKIQEAGQLLLNHLLLLSINYRKTGETGMKLISYLDSIVLLDKTLIKIQNC
jgi:hypothetical protein